MRIPLLPLYFAEKIYLPSPESEKMQSGGILLESRSKKYLCSQSTVCFIMSVTLPLGFFTSTGMLQDAKRLLAQK